MIGSTESASSLALVLSDTLLPISMEGNGLGEQDPILEVEWGSVDSDWFSFMVDESTSDSRTLLRRCMFLFIGDGLWCPLQGLEYNNALRSMNSGILGCDCVW